MTLLVAAGQQQRQRTNLKEIGFYPKFQRNIATLRKIGYILIYLFILYFLAFNGSMPAIPVQTWIRGDAGEWIGVTKSGATVTLWGVGQAQYLEIDSGREVLFLYYGAPALLTLKMDEKQ